MNPPSAEIFPGDFPIGRFELRNPFEARALTWQCREHLDLHSRNSPPSLRGFLRHWYRSKVYRRALLDSTQPKGRAALRIGDEWREFSFNASNTQFESIYAPDERNGYEPETAVLIDALLPDDGVMMDIGANWGHFSLLAASRPGFRGQVHAFEPMPTTHADLVASVQGTGMGSLVTTHDVALANSEGTAHMSFPDGERSGLASLGGNTGSPVRVTRLDRLGLPAPSLMKIDVEGHEAEVMQGARQTIRENRPMIIFESGLGGALPAVLKPFQVLEELGYRFFQPAFVRELGPAKAYTPYGRNSDLSGKVSVALVSFAPMGRWMLSSHANIFACHADRVAEVAALFRRSTGEKANDAAGL